MFEGFNFQHFFDDISKKKILIIGDVMIDTYLWGNVDRVSPEAPVPIVSDIIEESRLGGAANVALNVKSLGAVPILCSVIGGDERGIIFLELLEEQNLSDVGITVDEFRMTTQKTRVISGFKHLLRIDEEIESSLSHRIQDSFVEMIHNLMKTGGIDAIVFQDYDKGVITKSLITEIVELALKLNIPIMVDPKYRNFEHYEKVTIFKPNLKEFSKGLKVDLSKNEIDKLVVVGEKFRKTKQQDILMLTLSDKGVLVLTKEGHHYLPAVVRDVTDVSGAGDTVISVAALCYAGGMTPVQTAAVANLAGGQVCEKSGVIPVIRDQLLSECLKNFVD
ncbi:bifunctional heptose 7-phosphate kinase/heptose 1-phosphate adenyltransferase [Bacteroidota bacterium]